MILKKKLRRKDVKCHWWTRGYPRLNIGDGLIGFMTFPYWQWQTSVYYAVINYKLHQNDQWASSDLVHDRKGNWCTVWAAATSREFACSGQIVSEIVNTTAYKHILYSCMLPSLWQQSGEGPHMAVMVRCFVMCLFPHNGSSGICSSTPSSLAW